MRFLEEHRRRPAALADHLPWAALVAPGVVLNKDGSFTTGFRFRGPDLESSTEDELMAVRARLIADRAPAAVLVNESPSLPKGVYIRAFGKPPEPGSIVAVSQPASVRAYLGNLGMPADVRLIKRVAATAGDQVCAVDDHMVLPGRIVRVRREDRQGVILAAWPGCRRLGPGELFLLGDTPSSFDSRYFGPVHDDQVEGVFKKVLTW